MTTATLSVNATFENGVFRPDRPLTLGPRQKVTLLVQLQSEPAEWPDNVAEACGEVADEDRRLAETVCHGVPGQRLLQFCGVLSPEDANLMRQAIECGCESVDAHEW